MIWLLIAIVLVVIEAVTVGLFTIWFAVGSVVAMFAALLSAELWLQIVLFSAVSILMLIFTKPLVKKRLMVKEEKTNADRIIAKEATVTEAIEPNAATGQVKVMGQVWSAKAELPIAVGEKVVVTAIEGVKAVVAPVEGANIDAKIKEGI